MAPRLPSLCMPCLLALRWADALPRRLVSLPTRLSMSLADDISHSFVRLDKILAERGAGSRKDVDRMIRKGLVEVEGEIAGKADAKRKVPWSSTPLCDGIEYPPPPLLVAYHKPLGVVSSMRDERGRMDLSDVLPFAWQKLLVRLDPAHVTPCYHSMDLHRSILLVGLTQIQQACFCSVEAGSSLTVSSTPSEHVARSSSRRAHGGGSLPDPSSSAGT